MGNPPYAPLSKSTNTSAVEAQDDACEPDRPPGELERIVYLLDRLGGKLSALEDRLRAVLSTPNSVPEEAIATAPNSEIEDLRRLLERYVDRLEDITARVTL